MVLEICAAVHVVHQIGSTVKGLKELKCVISKVTGHPIDVTTVFYSVSEYPWAGGTYTGGIDGDCRPHGHGEFHKSGATVKGNFKHGDLDDADALVTISGKTIRGEFRQGIAKTVTVKEGKWRYVGGLDSEFLLDGNSVDMSIEGEKGGYHGGMANGHFCGQGSYNDGSSTWAGVWSDGLLSDGQKVFKGGATYYGQFDAKLKRHGEGTHKFVGGDIFTGHWENDEWVRGTYTFKDGSKQHGTFDGDGKLNGHGTEEQAGGTTHYEGQFKDHKWHGVGTKTEKGKYIYKGKFENDKFHGQGDMKWDTGDVYFGQWKDGSREGKGKWTCPAGNVYDGEWKNGVRTGHGTFQWAGKDKYVGQWLDDKRHGSGTFQWADKDKYVGQWLDDKRHGSGNFVKLDGTVYKEEWSHGTLKSSTAPSLWSRLIG